MNLSRILIFALIVCFGFLTLFMSTSVIFDLFGVRELEGNYVPFIVWINFASSLFYLLAGYGYWFRKKWAYNVLAVNVLLLLIGLVALFIYINEGGVYESRTVFAMIFRIALTVFLLVYLKRDFRKSIV